MSDDYRIKITGSDFCKQLLTIFLFEIIFCCNKNICTGIQFLKILTNLFCQMIWNGKKRLCAKSKSFALHCCRYHFKRLARTNAMTVKIMSRPALTATSTPKDWFKHRRTYVNAARVSNAQVFIQEHAAAFTESWQRYQVPPQIVAAVIGVETNYGRLTGNIRTLDALCTLSFDYTRRAAFFQNELESFLTLMWQGKADPTSVKGSFAGALGICQFMPSNIEKLGVDLDGDGVVNLSESADDAIGSAAHYLREVGWVRGLPVSWPCRVTPEIVRWFDTGEARLTTSLQNLLDAGIELPAPLPVSPKTSVLLVSLPAGKTTVYRVGTANFAALLDYNRSFFYAQTVSDLADSILSGDVLPPEALPAA